MRHPSNACGFCPPNSDNCATTPPRSSHPRRVAESRYQAGISDSGSAPRAGELMFVTSMAPRRRR
jgi:hypothetical protein